jgi:hypothetical protein
MPHHLGNGFGPEDEAAFTWVRRFALITREVVLGSYIPQSCVESIRIGSEVARYFGRTLIPLPVRVLVATQSWLDSSGRVGWAAGTVNAGTVDVPRRGWNGHLAGLLDDTWYVDLSADQFDRPRHGMAWPMPAICLANRAAVEAGIVIRNPQAPVVYHAIAVDDSLWRTFPAWTAHQAQIRKSAGLAIRALKQVDRAAATQA